MQEDTISAVATAPGEGGIGIIRLSGRTALDIAGRIFRDSRGNFINDFISHKALYGHVVDPFADDNIIDECLMLPMPAPHSYTREDVAEFHCHGGSLSVGRILALTLKMGARLAEQGEFTKRAFLNGRIDLAQAEAVIDIIQAKTELSLNISVKNLAGNLSSIINNMRDRCLQMIAQLEATIDFPEEDIEELENKDIEMRVKNLIVELDMLLSTAETGRIMRDGLKTAIIGKPNVGKSSLLNALLREKRAIVTDIPGTTRDTIEEYVNIGGVPLRIIDTAGIRETDDHVEKIGVTKAKETLLNAGLVLVMFDASQPLDDEDRQVLSLLADKKAIILVNKSDLPRRLDFDELSMYGETIVTVSLLEGVGLDNLEKAIVDMVYEGKAKNADSIVANVRHIDLLSKTRNHLSEAAQSAKMNLPPDCTVIDLRAAWESLGMITGETVGEDLLDRIFSQFCIGK